MANGSSSVKAWVVLMIAMVMATIFILTSERDDKTSDHRPNRPAPTQTR